MNLQRPVKTKQLPKRQQLALSAKLLALAALLFALAAVVLLVHKHWGIGFMYGSLAVLESSLAFVFHTLSRRDDDGEA